MEKKPRKKTVLILAMTMGVLVIAAIGILVINQQRKEAEAAAAEAAATQASIDTATAVIQQTSTATAAVYHTILAQHTATVSTIRTATADANATGTQTILDGQKLFDQLWEEYTREEPVSEIERNIVFRRTESGARSCAYSSFDGQNFAVKLEFFLPYGGPTDNDWTFGVIFRMQDTQNFEDLIVGNTLGYMVDYRSFWNLDEKYMEADHLVHVQDILFDYVEEDVVVLEFIAIDDVGYIALNDHYLLTLDLSSRLIPGKTAVCVGLGWDDIDEDHRATLRHFTLWGLD